jgi:four helix bundle protein
VGKEFAAMAVQSYRDLIAWQRAMDLVIAVYQATRDFPKEEVYGLTNQVRRAAVSVPSNIAEGQGRGLGGEFSYHLRVAMGSLQEMQTQLMIGLRLGYLTSAAFETMDAATEELGRIIRGLQKSVDDRCGG